MRHGYIQIYTGNGKGKSTAAFGLALRASGAGLKVWIGQFLKDGNFSEIKAIKKLNENIEITQFGMPGFIFNNPTDEDIKKAEDGLAVALKKISSKKYDIIILDELCTALSMGLISINSIKKIMTKKPTSVELIMTGRGATDELISLADLVTEMREIKHYYQDGVTARVGIEK